MPNRKSAGKNISYKTKSIYSEDYCKAELERSQKNIEKLKREAAEQKASRETENIETDAFCNSSCSHRGNCSMMNLEGFERRSLCHFAHKLSTRNKVFSQADLLIFLLDNRQ